MQSLLCPNSSIPNISMNHTDVISYSRSLCKRNISKKMWKAYRYEVSSQTWCILTVKPYVKLSSAFVPYPPPLQQAFQTFRTLPWEHCFQSNRRLAVDILTTNSTFLAVFYLFITTFLGHVTCAALIDGLLGMSSVCVGARQSCACATRHIRISFRSQGNEPWRTHRARPRAKVKTHINLIGERNSSHTIYIHICIKTIRNRWTEYGVVCA